MFAHPFRTFVLSYHINSRKYTFNINGLLVIFPGAVAVALAESGGEGRGFSGSVQMGEVSEAGHAEDGLAGLTLFGRDDGDA